MIEGYRLNACRSCDHWHGADPRKELGDCRIRAPLIVEQLVEIGSPDVPTERSIALERATCFPVTPSSGGCAEHSSLQAWSSPC